MFKKLLKWLGIESKTYISVEDLVASYDPSTQQVGVKQGALDHVNMARFRKGERFEFRGSPTDFVIIPKPQKDSEDSNV